MKLHTIDISMLDDFVVGNAEDRGKGTGCTVIICEKGAVGGVDVRGGGTATRETDLLKSENNIQGVNAVILSGGSSFGLEAASGVARELADHGIGFRVGDIAVPLVCGASLFDLNVGDSKAFPDVEMGIEATKNAFNGKFRNGNSGAGTGASVGKTKGMSKAMKSGLGTFACGDGSIEVGAVVAVNAMGDVYNGAGNIIAGLRSEDGNSIFGTIRTLKEMVLKDKPKKTEKDVPERDPIPSAVSVSRAEHKDRMKEVAKAIKEEFRKTDQYRSEEILKADRRYKEEKRRREEQLREQQLEEERLREEALLREARQLEEERLREEASFVPEPETVQKASSQVTQSFIDEGHFGKHMKREEAGGDYAKYSSAAPEEKETEEFLEGFEDNAGEDGDLGYDIPFNTTIGCLITNAKLTRSQANKLASILHDAYARAIKPVHSTLDGDTVFVLASGKCEVNFDAFAALAADVMQYAIIDAAMSARSAYGLPSASDFAVRR